MGLWNDCNEKIMMGNKVLHVIAAFHHFLFPSVIQAAPIWMLTARQDSKLNAVLEKIDSRFYKSVLRWRNIEEVRVGALIWVCHSLRQIRG